MLLLGEELRTKSGIGGVIPRLGGAELPEKVGALVALSRVKLC